MNREMKVTFSNSAKVEALYKGFVIKTDQPVYQGGEGTAPAPFDLFLASIATCSAWYVLAFCQKRNIPLEGGSLIQETQRNPETKRIDKIIIKVLLPEGFPEKYKKAVIKSIDGCAVKAHLENPPAFEVKTS
ncbi:MAG: OsmC family protein [Candidatus Aminicenantes bacterium]|nr:OsmC family protein [Candidatus Aminicenantes bacterium]